MKISAGAGMANVSGVHLLQAKTLKEARKLAPWAVKIVRVEDEYLAFESAKVYDKWLSWV